MGKKRDSVIAAQRGRTAGESVQKENHSLVCLGSLSHLGPDFQSASNSLLKEGEKKGGWGKTHTLIKTHTDLHTALAEAISSHTHHYFLMIYCHVKDFTGVGEAW